LTLCLVINIGTENKGIVQPNVFFTIVEAAHG